VYALNPNGTLQWKFQTGAWVHSSPTIGPDGTIYIGSDDSYLYALNPENGTMIWRCHLNGGTWCSPTRGNDGVLYLGTYDMRFHAIYPNGTIKWTYNAPGRIWFGSSASVSSDGTIYFGTTTQDGGAGALVALNPDGTERFKNTYGYYATSPVIGEDGTVYAASFNYAGHSGHLHAFGRGPLQADAGGPYSTYAGEPFTVSEDIYGGVPPYTCHWDFGDGNTSNERHPTHTYSIAGNYTIMFTVTDDDYNTSVDSTTITITYGPPHVYFEKPEYGVYVFDRKIRSSTSPIYLIFGRITLIINASHPVAGINRVEFYIDAKLRATDTTSPYSFIWRQPYLFNWAHSVRVVAVSTVGTVAERQCVMFKFL
jgi:outer membrane protein assembly factor BamB